MPDQPVRVNDALSDTMTEQYALPTIAPGWGGLPVERAWEQIARDAGHVDRWQALLSRARASVMYYIQKCSAAAEPLPIPPALCLFVKC